MDVIQKAKDGELRIRGSLRDAIGDPLEHDPRIKMFQLLLPPKVRQNGKNENGGDDNEADAQAKKVFHAVIISDTGYGAVE